MITRISKIVFISGFAILIMASTRASFAQSAQETEWNGLVVKQDRFKAHTSGSRLAVSLTIARKSDGKILYEDELYDFFTINSLRMNSETVLTILGHSGGESGCCGFAQAIVPQEAGMESIYIDETVGDIPSIGDLDRNGIDEVRSESEQFYGYSMISPDRSCVAYLTNRSYLGMSDIHLPVYKTLERKKNGTIAVQDITFSEDMRPALQDKIKKVEEELKKSNKVINTPDDPTLAVLFQYIYYQTQIGQRTAGLSFLNQLGINVYYHCDKNLDEERIVSLLSLVDGNWKTVINQD